MFKLDYAQGATGIRTALVLRFVNHFVHHFVQHFVNHLVEPLLYFCIPLQGYVQLVYHATSAPRVPARVRRSPSPRFCHQRFRSERPRRCVPPEIPRGGTAHARLGNSTTKRLTALGDKTLPGVWSKRGTDTPTTGVASGSRVRVLVSLMPRDDCALL